MHRKAPGKAYTYDALHRMTSRTDADGTATYAYDAVGNLTSATNAAGTVAFAYDALSRTTAVTNEDGTTTAYAYDANGNRLSITYPDGKAVTYTYDANGSVASITDHDGTGVTYTRDAEGRVTKEHYTDGSSTEYDYNAAGQLVQQEEVTPEHVTRRQTTYAYDDAGNLTSENRAGVGVAPADEFARYWYDAANRLVKTSLEGETTEYTYDLAGNLLSDGESTYTYDVQNRLLTKTSADGTVSYTYDAAGNLVSDGATTYTYNAQNKLIRGENADGESSTYVYNALGARIENVQVRKNENAGHANAALDSGSRYARDYTAALSDNRAAWQRVWETEAGTVVQNDFETVTKHYVVDYLSAANRDIFVTEEGSFTQRYVYDAAGKRLSAELDYADGTARGEAGENPASDIAAGIGKVWYRTSALNSTLFAVDADGAVVAHMIYDPWGRALLETYTDANFSGLDNLNNFTGYAWDETLGLYFAQNRFYDAALHRFTQEDAIRDGGNWYVYCGNNPLVYVDPWGQSRVEGEPTQEYDIITVDGRKYISVQDLAYVYGGGELRYDSTMQKGGRTVRYHTGISKNGFDFDYSFYTRQHGAYTPALTVRGHSQSFTIGSGNLYNNGGTNYVDLDYFQELICKISQPRADIYRLVGGGVQFEVGKSSTVNVGGSAGVEMVFYFDEKVLNANSQSNPLFYVYGGPGISSDISETIREIARIPSILADGAGTFVTLGGVSVSFCAFAIFGNDFFSSPADYRGEFFSTSGTINHKKAYVSWSNTATVAGGGWSSDTYSVSAGYTQYGLIGDGEFLDGSIDFSKVEKYIQNIVRTVKLPEGIGG